MTKCSPSFQRNIIFTTLRALLCFILLRACWTRNYFSDLDLSSQTLNPSVRGFKMTGNAANDQFGSSVRTAGDIDNDGYDDIVVGAYNKNSLQGAAYVIYGREESSFLDLDLSTITLDPATTGFMIIGEAAGDHLGWSVSAAGDIDNDGYDDIIVGAYGKNSFQGVAYVIYGRTKSSMSNWDFSSGATLNPSTTGFMIIGNAGDYLGTSVSTAGDIDGDGYDDIIIGTPAKNSQQGAAYVIYGGPKSTMSNIALSSTLDPASTGFMITGHAAGDYFGDSVSTAGDINHDGFDDIIIGAARKGSNRGAAYVIYGGAKSIMAHIILSSTTLNPLTTGFMITGDVAGDLFGYPVSTAGDINNDGYDDIIIGADSKSSNKGAAYVIYGGLKPTRSNIVLSSTTLDPTTTGFMITGKSAGDYLGHSVSTAGDINNDGYDDIIVGAYQKNTAYVIYGRAKSAMSNIVLSSTTLDPLTTGFMITGNAASDNFGLSVNTAGDINNDGYDDIIVGAPAKNSNKGVAYVIYAGCSPNCKQCSSESVCTECKSSYLMYQSKCFASCPDTTFASTTTTCADCPADCKKCSSTSVCTECKSSYLMYQSECFSSCPDATFASTATTCQDCSANCNHCSSPSVCTECQSSYLMYQSKCFASCPDATFANTPTTCQDCPVHCKHCSSTSVCTECQSSYLMYQSGCFVSCPDTTFASTATTCQDCPTDCKHCSSTSICIECQNSYLMYQSECFASCPEETLATSTTKCEDCPANCKHCSSTPICTECKSSYLMYQSECFASCPDATFASTTTTCQDCSVNCNQCLSASVCTECQNSYLLYQSECFDSCPDATFASTTTSCQDCPNNCNHCTSASLCAECISPFVLYKSLCLPSCPNAMFNSNNVCEDCPAYCSSCTSQDSCQFCYPGFTLSNSLCTLPSPLPSNSSYQEVQERATQALSSTARGITSVISVGSVVAPLTALVSKTVQNTRYLNLSVTSDLAEIYQTWGTDLIPWEVPNAFSNEDHFKSSPSLFTRYDIDSPFLVNFWSTLLNIVIGFGTFTVCFVFQKFLQQAKYEGWAYSLLQKLVAGSFNFALVQAYSCLDDILFYLVLDAKTNPFNTFFSWASMICAVIFLVLGCLLVFFNFWIVKKYQSIKKQGKKEIEDFNEKNKYWELFYSDFNDNNFWSQSFFATLIIRSAVSSFIITVLYDYPLLQTSFLLTLDGAILLFLYGKAPFNTLRGTLAQYFYEIITLLVHMCTFILSLQDRFQKSSDTVRLVFSTGIIYLNTALLGGSLGFLFIEIYKTISEKKRAAKLKNKPKDIQETQSLQPSETNAKKRQDWSVEKLNLNGNVTTYNLNVETSQVLESNFNAENSREFDMDASSRINQQIDHSTTTIFIRRKMRRLNPRQQENL